ncbi:MAG: hypothetical protein ACLRSW_11685 [Christensenellaceae bacterium]
MSELAVISSWILSPDDPHFEGTGRRLRINDGAGVKTLALRPFVI